MNNWIWRTLLPLLLAAGLVTGCGAGTVSESTASVQEQTTAETAVSVEEPVPEAVQAAAEASQEEAVTRVVDGTVPAYSGAPYVEVNGNVPYFSDEEMTTESFEYYSELDELGRCGTAYANIGTDLMPTEKRGSIGSVKPSGWQNVKYAGLVDGNYLYNRCHLIGYQLSAENANKKNLITGTRHLNVAGMLPFENMVADFVKETEYHVLYRVTPIFAEANLVASGVQIEAKSVEDHGEGILFNVYCYNVQPGIVIDYANGSSAEGDTIQALGGSSVTLEEQAAPTPEAAEVPAPEVTEAPVPEVTEAPVPEAAEVVEVPAGRDYVVNTNTGKFHVGSCSSLKLMNEENRMEIHSTREELMAQGYDPCGRCHP